MNTLRLFFAVWPPEEVRDRLWRSLSGLRDETPGVRWVPRDRYHVTLRFVGDVREQMLPRLVRAAAVLAGEPPFRARFTGSGTFPRRGMPRVYWVGCRADPLLRMRRLLDHGLVREGIELEGRKFTPHLTVGRTVRRSAVPRSRRTTAGKRGAEAATDCGATDCVATDWFRVDAVHIVRSRLFPDGPRYANVHRVALTGRKSRRTDGEGA